MKLWMLLTSRFKVSKQIKNNHLLYRIKMFQFFSQIALNSLLIKNKLVLSCLIKRNRELEVQD